MDGGQFDTVTIHTTSQTVQCHFHKFLDDNDYELGSDCVVGKWKDVNLKILLKNNTYIKKH